jgi:hypothetical protein
MKNDTAGSNFASGSQSDRAKHDCVRTDFYTVLNDRTWALTSVGRHHAPDRRAMSQVNVGSDRGVPIHDESDPMIKTKPGTDIGRGLELDPKQVLHQQPVHNEIWHAEEPQ